MIVLGLNRANHDASACLLRDGRLVSFINVERLTRRKHDHHRLWEAIRYCLDVAGVRVTDVDLVVQNSYGWDLAIQDPLWASSGKVSPDAEYLAQFSTVETITHHLAHAYCGIGLAPFDECAVLVADGIGQVLSGDQAEAETYYHYGDDGLAQIYQRAAPLSRDGMGFHGFQSIGALYSVVSSYLFGHWNHCGKVMGLAPYGTRSPFDQPLITKNRPELEIDLSFRERLTDSPCLNDHDWGTRNARYENLAWAAQTEIEAALVHIVRWLHDRTRSDQLVFSGGVALNCVANERLFQEAPFRRLFVPPCCGDDGIAVGCAFYGWLVHGSGKKVFSLAHPYYGKTYSATEAMSALREEPSVAFRIGGDTESRTAEALDAGKIVAWCRGASAMGPRALGNRSIFADPRNPAMKDILNSKIKHREAFRPYGASVLAEKADEVFHCGADRPYMTFAVRVREDYRQRIPAVVHVDDTCRPQTVREGDNPRLHRLLTCFYERTGIPLLLNTSFNGCGEPIVETPEDALRCFVSHEIDFLVLEDVWVEKRPGWRPDDPATLLHCRLVGLKQLDVVARHYPGGRREYEVAAPHASADERLAVPSQLVDILASLDTSRSVHQILRDWDLTPRGRAGRECLKLLWRMHQLGWIRIVPPKAN